MLLLTRPLCAFFENRRRTQIGGRLALAALALVAGCGYAQGPAPAPTAAACGDPAAATYAAAIAPIFDANCRQCHGSAVYQALGGGHDFGTYQAIKSQSASQLLGCVRHDPGFDAMPQGGAKLSDCDIARLEAWVAAGQLDN